MFTYKTEKNKRPTKEDISGAVTGDQTQPNANLDSLFFSAVYIVDVVGSPT